MGKYTCLLCQKEFSSESGVKYHICKTHSQVSHKTCTKTTSHPPTLSHTVFTHIECHAHSYTNNLFRTPCCPLILIQNWFRATGQVSNKTKDSQSNKLQKDMKNGVPWKKRGRKPKEHLVERASTREKTLNSRVGPSMNHQTLNLNTSLLPIQTSSQNPACTIPNNIPTHGKNLTHNRDLQPPVKKRAKPKKAPLTE